MTPRLHLNPGNDERFAALAGRLLGAGDLSPGTLERGLRTEFPLAVVHVRELTGEAWPTWYVYRDGHWIR